ncbi:cytochrome P450 [Streptomyces sulfonofaciens]|uniref:Cytochrome P450 n=1 Tax=Streptomyces sulfonofaciens TaxID=68272 RepID=A0A919GNE8_9ACTN|nr:cytochrome P450 [Streptomyces sulfonofaciens]GHH87121.1 cytochrome P450 [Streptomyces sulfonofaciens]
MTTDQTPPAYPFEHPGSLDMNPLYAELRERTPLARVRMPYGGEAWLVTRYEDIKRVLADHRFSRAATLGKDVPRVLPTIPTARSIVTADPPEHTRLRNLVSKAFTAERVERLRGRTQEIATELIDRMVEQGPPVDLVQAFSMPLPVTVFSALLGVPLEDRDRFNHWVDAIRTIGSLTPDEVELARRELDAYLAGMVAQRRAQPTDDILGALVAARDDQDRLSEEELIIFGVTLLIAGSDTTVNQIGNFVYTLLTQPEALSLLREDRSLLPGALDELLRITPMGTTAGVARIATEDVELAGGVVRAGEAVFVRIASGNRDRTVFDDPDTFDMTRDPNPHIAFGFGVHYCTGAQLARMELEVALGSLLDRLPGLRLAVRPEDVTFKHDRLLQGPWSLPVTW